MMTGVSRVTLALALCAGHGVAGHGVEARAADSVEHVGHADSVDPVDERQQVLRFCERFAGQAPALSGARDARYVEHSATVRQRSMDRVITFLSNAFQPFDSRFVGAWQCEFRVMREGHTCDGEVSLPIAEHRAFAEHTQWPRLMVVPDHVLVDAAGNVTGYIVPKYYALDCAEE